jgi:hypothetical protein
MNKQEQLAEQIADNPERFGMARLHLFNQLIDLRPKERELRGKLETAKNDKQKAFFQKALTNVQGWIEEFAAAYELLGEKPAAIVEAMGVQPDLLSFMELKLNEITACIHMDMDDNEYVRLCRKQEGIKSAIQLIKDLGYPAKAVEAMPKSAEKMKCICRTELEQQACCATCDKNPNSQAVESMPESDYKYSLNEKKFQEIQFKGIGISDEQTFEQRVNTAIALAWECIELRKKVVEAQKGMKWVKASERLPEEGGRYWCYVRDLTDLGFSYFQWNCAYNEREKRFSDRYLTNGETVTHWMPLPEPPSESASSRDENTEGRV